MFLLLPYTVYFPTIAPLYRTATARLFVLIFLPHLCFFFFFTLTWPVFYHRRNIRGALCVYERACWVGVIRRGYTIHSSHCVCPKAKIKIKHLTYYGNEALWHKTLLHVIFMPRPFVLYLRYNMSRRKERWECGRPWIALIISSTKRWWSGLVMALETISIFQINGRKPSGFHFSCCAFSRKSKIECHRSSTYPAAFPHCHFQFLRTRRTSVFDWQVGSSVYQIKFY